MIQVLYRILAVFIASALGAVGAGTIAGISMFNAIFIAGITSVMTVGEALARSYIKDGKLTLDEINKAFDLVDKEDS